MVSCFALGEKQLYATSGGAMHDGVVLVLIIVAHIVHGSSRGSGESWRHGRTGMRALDPHVTCIPRLWLSFTAAAACVIDFTRKLGYQHCIFKEFKSFQEA